MKQTEYLNKSDQETAIRWGEKFKVAFVVTSLMLLGSRLEFANA
jgi:hypothetical protein